MGDLLATRVNRIARAFIHTGMDYADPIAVRTAPGQIYASCVMLHDQGFTLRARDYSSSIFIAAHQRFVSCRGLPQSMYSDNGIMFYGGNRELSDAHTRAIRDPNFRNRLTTSGTAWHFLSLSSRTSTVNGKPA